MTTGQEENASTVEREVVLTRLIDASRELVWKALTEPNHVNQWWGPDGFKNIDVEMDFRVGGVWRFKMLGPMAVFIRTMPCSERLRCLNAWPWTMAMARICISIKLLRWKKGSQDIGDLACNFSDQRNSRRNR